MQNLLTPLYLTKRVRQIFILAGMLILLATAAWFVVDVYARIQAKPAALASPLHPNFALLDENGVNVLESDEPLSTMQTCGQCHDTAYISSHSFHTDLGYKDQAPSGDVPGGRAWDTSPGLYGKWDPLTYRYLSPEGDERIDLDTAGWVEVNASRLVGGGPALDAGLEMDCFVCHLTSPDQAARTTAIESGHPEWASTASLAQTGIVTASGSGYTWNASAFNLLGELDNPFVTIQDPSNDNCAQCHGIVQTDPEQYVSLTGCSLDEWQTATTGQVFSGQLISLSGVNLKGKADLTHSWDIHAERGLQCTDCHFSLNNPAYAQVDEASSPDHLQFDPRRLEIGEYLQKPDHNFARGESAQFTIDPDLKGTMRRCESCHDASLHADWLPYVDRHMQELACESCHIPQLSATAVQSYDWTVLKADGQPSTACRGVEGPTDEDTTGSLSELVTGFQPVLLQRQNIDGELLLAPYNLVSSWYWVYETPEGPRPVRLVDLQSAWLSGSGYAPEVTGVFDADGDGELSPLELRIDTPEKETLIASRLQSLGLQDPYIQGDVQPYSINHDVVDGDVAVQDCQSCHTSQSRLAQPMLLSGDLPGGVMPEFVQGTNVQASGDLYVQDGALFYRPETSDYDLYVFGHDRVAWIDIIGLLFFLGVLGAVSIHGGLRFYQSIRQRKSRGQQTDELETADSQKVYMYHIYERFWHWLQTFTIVLLLFTGLVIHRPDLLGFLSFRYMVTLHNILAAILVLNAGLSLFYHLASGEIRQYIPHPYGFFDQAILQAKYYLGGIFKGSGHPFEKTPNRKLNPLQQVTYLGILNVLLPLQIITGALMWGVQRWPEIAGLLGGLPFLAPFHSLVAWTFAAFIVAHVYLTTTVGSQPLAGIKAMVMGYEDVEEPGGHPVVSPQPASPTTDGEQPQAAAAD